MKLDPLPTVSTCIEPPGYEPVSPELALVDPELRRLLLAGDPRALWFRVGEPPLAQTAPWPPIAPAPEARPRSRWRTWEVAAAASGAVIAMLVANALGALPDPGRSSPILEPAASVSASSGGKASVPAPSHAVSTRPRRAVRPAPPKAKRPAPTKPKRPAPARPTVVHQQLEWAPVQAADSYEVALYRGATRVFSERTRRASIEIGIARSPAGAVGHRALSPGTYTWYVWPWRGGHRLGRAVVASKLVLTAAGA